LIVDSWHEPLFAGIQDESSRLKSDVAEFFRLRWRLARLEIQTAVHSARRLAIAVAVAAVLLLCSLPVLVVAWAKAWDGWLSISFAGWAAIFGLGMALFAAGLAGLSYQRFRAEFVGLEQSFEEFSEDIAWLEERLTRVKG
jgi:hypothetical protein